MGGDFKAFTAEVDAMPAKEREEFIKAWGEPEELHPDLLPYQVELEHSGTWIKHPLIFSMMHDQALNAHVNRQYVMKVKALTELEDRDEWMSAVWIHERPHRFEALERMQDFMPDKEFWETVAEVWTDSENIWQHQEEWEWLLSSERPGREHIMDDGERMFLRLLPRTVTVYRGYHRDGREDGLSWTHDPSRAEFFATYMCYGKEELVPRVVKGTVAKSDIIAIFDGRNENEIIVCDPSCIYDREETVIESVIE